jgi:hypothetical protein
MPDTTTHQDHGSAQEAAHNGGQPAAPTEAGEQDAATAGRIEARCWTVLAIAFLVFLATQLPHTASGMTAALSAGGGLLLGPIVIESFAPREMSAGAVRRPYRWFILACAVAGLAFLLVGINTGHLRTASAGQREYLIGVGILTITAMVVPTMFWLRGSALLLLSSFSDERRDRLYRWFAAIEDNGIWTTLGSGLFIAGIVVGFASSV